jgi:hypothetical protein
MRAAFYAAWGKGVAKSNLKNHLTTVIPAKAEIQQGSHEMLILP